MEPEAFIEASNKAVDLESLEKLAVRATAELGYDQMVLFRLPDQRIRGPQADVTLISRFPDDWLSYYADHQYEDSDPIPECFFNSQQVIQWDRIEHHLSLSARSKLVMDECRSTLHNGISIPVHGPFGLVMGLSLARTDPQGSDHQTISTCRIIANQLALVTNALDHSGQETLTEPLTIREREVLARFSQNLTVSEVAERLLVSDHTVKFHTQNLFRKLNVSTRVSAVVKAIRLGILAP